MEEEDSVMEENCVLIHLTEDHPDLQPNDDIQFLLCLAGQCADVVFLSDLRGLRQMGIQSVHDIIREKWLYLEPIGRPWHRPWHGVRSGMLVLIHLFALWFESWMNVEGETMTYWRKFLNNRALFLSELRMVYNEYKKLKYNHKQFPTKRRLKELYGRQWRFLMIPRRVLAEQYLLDEVPNSAV
jgi:hypothetical protein